jgi:hypothetical protein
MHWKTATILLFAILFRFVYISGMLTDYVFNYADYLARCENREKPKMNCNGQCVLMKSIKDMDQEFPEPIEGREINIHIHLYYFIAETIMDFSFAFPSSEKPLYIDKHNLTCCFFEIFHPPKYVS